jgi:hypothetical protein
MNAPPPLATGAVEQGAVPRVRRDGVRDRVNEFRARRDRRDEKVSKRPARRRFRRSRGGRTARLECAFGGRRAVGKQETGGLLLESAKMFTASRNAFVTL